MLKALSDLKFKKSELFPLSINKISYNLPNFIVDRLILLNKNLTFSSGQACMDAVVNPPREGEQSFESWDAEVKGVLASLKRLVDIQDL